MSVRVGRHNEPGAVYIGRGSPLGNPFVIGRDGDRDAVCERFEQWLTQRIALGNEAVLDELRHLYRLARDGNLVLGCFCAPRRCHGDSIKRFLEAHLAGEDAAASVPLRRPSDDHPIQGHGTGTTLCPG